MRWNKQLFIVLICSLCAINCGCLINHSNHVVLRQNEALRPLAFESPTARQNFESAVEYALDNEADRSRASFAVPFLFGLERSTKVAKNAIRNDLAALMDINRDGYISDYEISVRSKTNVD